MFSLSIVKISYVQLGVYPFSKSLLYLLIRTLSPFLYFILVRDLFCFLIVLKQTFPRFMSLLASFGVVLIVLCTLSL